jgi:hypothetical protein
MPSAICLLGIMDEACLKMLCLIKRKNNKKPKEQMSVD